MAPRSVDIPAVADDGTLEAIVAHGLIGSLAVATGSASMLLRDKTFDPTTERWLLDSITEQSALVVEGMRTILDTATQSFVDAATTVALAAGALPDVAASDRRPVLEALLRASDTLRNILGGLVRGLPPEVVEMLDELASSHSLDLDLAPPEPAAATEPLGR